MSFQVSEREAWTGLKRRMPKVPRRARRDLAVTDSREPSKEQEGFAQSVDEELGYSGLKRRLEQVRAQKGQSSPEVVMEVIRSLPVAAPLTEKSVARYKRMKTVWNSSTNVAKIACDVGLVFGLMSPVLVALLAVDADKTEDKSSPASRCYAALAGAFLGLVVWAIVAGIGVGCLKAFVFPGMPVGQVMLGHLVVASLLSRFPWQALERLEGTGSNKSFFDRRWFEWRKTSLESYSSNVPERVLQNALLLKKAFEEKGMSARFEVEEFSEVTQPWLQRSWLVDPFLILKVNGVELYMDWWDEKEFAPEYMY